MTKKILSLIICTALICSMITVVNVSAADGYISDGYLIYEDFEDGTLGGFSSGAISEWDDGNAVHLSANSYYSIDLPDYYIFEFDLNKTGNIPYNEDLSFKDSDAMNVSAFGIVLQNATIEKDLWYTYRIMIDQSKLSNAANDIYNADGVKVWRKVRDGEWDECVNNTHFKALKSNVHGAAGTIGFYAQSHTQFDIDNVKLYDGTYVSDIWFEDENGKVDQIPEGTLTAKYDIANFGGFEEVVAVTAIYDSEGKLLNCSKNVISDLEYGTETVEGSAVLMSDWPEAARVEAFLWTNTDIPQSIGSAYGVLGEEATVESSDTETTSIATSAGSDYSNDFAAIDRSTYANTLTVEGKHGMDEAVTVIVTVKAGDNTVVATQFKTAEDGSFKRTFVLNPDLCAGEENLTVAVSGVNTNPQTFGVVVASGWDTMAEAFKNAETADEIEDYLETYKANFSYYTAGEIDPVTAGVDSLVQDDDYADIEFVKSKTVYPDEMTYKDIVDASFALINSASAVDEFEEAFADAKANADADTMGSLIENAGFMQFPLNGVSNLAKVYADMADSDEEMSAITQIYDAFVEAHGAQKELEEATIPAFRGVDSGAALKDFFADNVDVLGIDPEKYVNDKFDNDYAVMFKAYEGKFSECDTYEKVNNAIVFLDNYINEYNQFLEDINLAETSDELKAVIESEFSYITLGLADSSHVVNREYLYGELEGKEFASLADVQAAFATAVTVQAGREANVLNDFMLISSVENTEAFFETFGEMIGVALDANYVVFYELYSKTRSEFENTVVDYTSAVAQVNIILSKVAEAESYIAEINLEAENDNWTSLQALYEGEKYAEFVGVLEDASDVRDVRSLYQRIAAAAPFTNLTQVKDAFENAHSDQLDYEEVAGGYESFDEELLDFVETAWSLKVQGNVVTLSGMVEERGRHNISLYAEDKNGLPIYMKQLSSNGVGDFDVTFILNPDFYEQTENEATLKVTGDRMNIYSFSPFKLYSEAELSDIIDGFAEINSKASLEEYFDTYKDILDLDVERGSNGKITERALEALYLIHSRNKADGRYEKITDIDEVLNGVDGESGTEALMAVMEEITTCLDELTAAANERIGSTRGNWSKIQKQVQLAIENEWISPDVSGKIVNVDKMYMRMTNKDYDLLSTVNSEYEKAYAAQVKADKPKEPSGGGIPSNGSDGIITSGGGGTSNPENIVMGGGTGAEKIDAPTNLPGHPEAPFKDVTSEYSWAKASINGLRRYGIVRGDGTGLYRPGDGVRREEFLKMLLDVFGIEKKDANILFTDTDKSAWYYSTVATAFEMGIVNGYPDGRFGIGDTITRADMAVMVCRAMEKLSINLDATDEAFLFNDFTAIPEYSYSSVVKLQRAGILNGDTFGYYNPLNNVTRAEAAVVFWSLFEGVSDMIDNPYVTEYKE